MTKVSEMSNEQLCEAISELREPEIIPDKMEFYISEGGNWLLAGTNKWEPINWLLPGSWTRLLVEMYDEGFIVALTCRSKRNVDLEVSRNHYMNDKWSIAVVRVKGENFEVRSDTKERASCEAYAIAFGGGKYE